MTVKIDCKEFNEKPLFIARMRQVFPEVFSLNYDSLIDGVRGTADNVTIELTNFGCYADAANLQEVFAIIERENPTVRFVLR